MIEMSRENNNKKDDRRIIYYRDELNDEFSTAEIEAKKIDGSWKYIRNPILCFFWYRIVATPIAFFYTKFKYKHKIVGKEKLKGFKNEGYFVYGNHTQILGDPLIPSFVVFPKAAHIIVHPNNVSMPYLGRVTPYMGGLPLPDDMAATRNFSAAIEQRISEKRAVFIYPEAHIWPYYTKIRPFGDASFSYPIKHKTPVFCFTNTYQKKGKSEHPQIVTYVDGPFYPDERLPMRERRKRLRDEVYFAMRQRAKLSNAEWIKYIPMSEENATEEQ
jgi:1-acyl-sn-glycerol-3-phosphate acyltransferase